MLAAVSGGSDSTALLLLLRDVLRDRAPNTQILVVTVDHGLRAGSDGEAERVAILADALGLAHRTLRWEGPKPDAGLPAAARNTRYHLLSRAADAAGARIVFTGHTADDQAETVAMRLARGEGRGTAGMAALTLFDGRLWIARPLLGVRRAALRSLLRERGHGWIEDPTNADPRFERARLRLVLGEEKGEAHPRWGGATLGRGSPTPSASQPPLPPPEGEESPSWNEFAPFLSLRRGERWLPEADGVGEPRPMQALHLDSDQSTSPTQPDGASTPGLLLLAQAAARTRRETARQAADLLRAFADHPAPGLFRLAPAFLESASREAAVDALRFLLATVGGRGFPVDAGRAGRLLDAMRSPGRHTLGGAVVERRKDAVSLHRENRGIAEAGSGAPFDGRFRLAPFPHPGSVGPWGGDRGPGLPASAPDMPRRLARDAFAALPAFRPLGGGPPVPPEAAGIHLTPLVAPFAAFLPGFDLPLAQALAQLVGAPAFPPAPGRDHLAGIA